MALKKLNKLSKNIINVFLIDNGQWTIDNVFLMDNGQLKVNLF
jgi:hypothetical protein